MIKRLPKNTILLLEDEALIALDLQETLESAGYDVVDVMSSCEAATAWLKDNSPALAIIDPKLRDGYCDQVAETLATRGIPFVVYSGEPRWTDGIQSSFSRGAWVTKPSDTSVLLSAIRLSSALQERGMSGENHSPRRNSPQ